MLVTVTISVFVRYFDLPVPNVAEWAVVAMAPLTFIGAAMCSYAQAHIAIDVVNLVRNSRIRRAARGLVAIGMLVFSAVYTWLGWVFYRDTLGSGEKMLDMGTPVAVPIFFLALGMTLMLFHAVAEALRVVGDEQPPEVDLA